MIELFHAPTPNGWKVSIMLAECELSFTLRRMKLTDGDQFRSDFLAVAVTHQSHVMQVVMLEERDKRIDRIGQADGGTVVVGPVAGQRRAVHDVTALSQVLGRRLHFSACMPGAMNDHIRICHIVVSCLVVDGLPMVRRDLQERQLEGA